MKLQREIQGLGSILREYKVAEILNEDQTLTAQIWINIETKMISTPLAQHHITLSPM